MSQRHFSRPTVASFVRLLQTEHLADDVEEAGLLGVVVVDEVHQVVVVKDVLDDALGRRAVVVQLAPLLAPQLKRLVLTQTAICRYYKVSNMLLQFHIMYKYMY